MKVVLLEGGRGNRPAVIEGWRTKIGLTDDDSITLLSWYPPREPLPVDLHVVFGPRMRLRTHARSGAVLLREIRLIAEAEERRRREEGLDLDAAYDDSDDEPMQDEGDLAEQLPESMVGAGGASGASGASDQHTKTGVEERRAEAGEALEEIIETAAAATEPAAAAPPPITASNPKDAILALPKHHPTRVKAAASWRVNKVRLRVRRSRSWPIRKGRVAVRKVIGGIPSEFALAVAGWDGASVVVGNADLVLALDSRSQKAAWVLARRVAGPAVVVSYPAAVRILGQRRAELADG